MGKRMTVSFRSSAEAALEELTAAGEMDITDVVNRGVVLLLWWRRQEAAGFRHQLKGDDGVVTDVVMLS